MAVYPGGQAFIFDPGEPDQLEFGWESQQTGSMSDKPKLLLVYHSQSGSTERMAKAVIAGARHTDIEGVELSVREALSATPADVLAASAYIFGTPENFGYMSGALKTFFDRCYYPCLEQVSGRPYSLFVRAGNDGTGALGSIQRIVSGWSLKLCYEPVVMAGEFDDQCLVECETLGMTLAAGLEAGIY